jgi:hypothetical protein
MNGRVAPPAMIVEKPYPPRMVVRLALCMMASAASVPAQEYATVVDDRVVADDVQPAPVADTAKLRGGWDLDAVISMAYDDNIFLSSRNPESDMIYRVAPTVAYTKGEEKEGEGGYVKAGYRPTGVIYTENGSENRIDHQAAATAGWRGKLTSITYNCAFQQLGDATADTGRPADRYEYQNAVRLAWIPREKVSLELAAGNNGTNYKDALYFDSSNNYAEVAARYTYSPKTQLGLIYQIGRFKVDGAGAQHTQQFKGDIVWQPREKILVRLEAGAEHRKSDNGTEVNPLMQGRLAWKPREGTELFVTGYMREEASAFSAGQNYSVRGATAGVSQRIRGNWSASLEGGYEKNSYQQVSGSGAAGRKDHIWFIRPALNYRFSKASDISLFYRASDDSSSDPAFGYEQQMIGLELNHKF